MKEIFQNKKIMIVAAHPDDELLGLGGTIKMIKRNFNCVIKVLILGEGITSRDKERDPKKRRIELKIHNENILNAKKILGYDILKTCNLKDNRFDSYPLLEIIKIIENEKAEFKPEIIFTHHEGDLNIDHQITFKAVMTASRPLPTNNTKLLITFETPSSTEWAFSNSNNNFNPNFFLEINEEDLNSKIKAMECYEFEKREYPHPRSPQSLQNLARFRGNTIGVNLAESFHIKRLHF